MEVNETTVIGGNRVVIVRQYNGIHKQKPTSPQPYANEYGNPKKTNTTLIEKRISLTGRVLSNDKLMEYEEHGGHEKHEKHEKHGGHEEHEKHEKHEEHMGEQITGLKVDEPTTLKLEACPNKVEEQAALLVHQKKKRNEGESYLKYGLLGGAAAFVGFVLYKNSNME